MILALPPMTIHGIILALLPMHHGIILALPPAKAAPVRHILAKAADRHFLPHGITANRPTPHHPTLPLFRS